MGPITWPAGARSWASGWTTSYPTWQLSRCRKARTSFLSPLAEHFIKQHRLIRIQIHVWNTTPFWHRFLWMFPAVPFNRASFFPSSLCLSQYFPNFILLISINFFSLRLLNSSFSSLRPFRNYVISNLIFSSLSPVPLLYVCTRPWGLEDRILSRPLANRLPFWEYDFLGSFAYVLTW